MGQSQSAVDDAETVEALRAEVAALKASQEVMINKLESMHAVLAKGEETARRRHDADVVRRLSQLQAHVEAEEHARYVEEEQAAQEAAWQAQMEAEVEQMAANMDRSAMVVQAARRGQLGRRYADEACRRNGLAASQGKAATLLAATHRGHARAAKPSFPAHGDASTRRRDAATLGDFLEEFRA